MAATGHFPPPPLGAQLPGGPPASPPGQAQVDGLLAHHELEKAALQERFEAHLAELEGRCGQ